MGSGKKIIKKVVKFASSPIMDPLGINKNTGLLTPVESMLAGEASPLDGLTGAATTRMAQQQAKDAQAAAEAQAKQAQQQVDATNQATQQAAQQAALAAQRDQLQTEANSQQQAAVSSTKAADVDLSLGGSSANRRKRYSSAGGGVRV